MNFNDKYGRQPVSFEPTEAPEYNPEPDIIWSGRVYPCDVCKTPTGWRFCYTDMPGVPCCSEACKAVKYLNAGPSETAIEAPPQPLETPAVSQVSEAPAEAAVAGAAPAASVDASSLPQSATPEVPYP